MQSAGPLTRKSWAVLGRGQAGSTDLTAAERGLQCQDTPGLFGKQLLKELFGYFISVYFTLIYFNVSILN